MVGTAMRRGIELLLVILLLSGGYLAVRSGGERRVAHAEYQRLVRLVGELPVEDPAKVSLVALETGDPMHFAWRVYLPPNYQLRLQFDGGSSSSWSANSVETVARVRFREGPDGRLLVYRQFGGGSSLHSRGDASVMELLRGQWQRLHVEQLGRDGGQSLDPTESVTLLRIVAPEDLQQQAKATLSHPSFVVPELFTLSLVPPRSTP